MNEGPKINTVDKILMLMLTGGADAADAAATLGIILPVIGPALPVISWFFGFAVSALLIFWLIMKGVSPKWLLGGSGVELIPIINGLPARTAALLATFAEDSGALPSPAKAVLGKEK